MYLNLSEEETEIQSSNIKMQWNFVKANSWSWHGMCVTACVRFLALGLLSVCSCIIKHKRQLLILYHANFAYTVLWLSRGRKLLLIIFGYVTVDGTLVVYITTQ